MKNYSFLIAVTLFASIALAGPLPGGGDPASVKVKVYGVYASTSPQCTNPINVFLKSTGDYVDLLKNPDLGGGDLPDGTYECVIIKMSDVIRHTPKVTDSTCVAGTEYSGEVCRAGGDGGMATNLDGSTITCTGDGTSTGAGDDTVFMFMTTDPSASTTGSRAFELPLAAGDGKGIKLGAPLVISSTTKAKFVVDATGGVVPGGGDCGINPPKFRFEKL
ncbi:MAG TPA: hypothetical protein VFH73_14445 [Polyangia bacterium]|jgi:hypothetical protein|nr:hypothetical protein [Polyangia bacterium]